MAAKRRSKTARTTRRATKTRATKAAGGRSRAKLSTTYARPRAADLPPVPAGYVGALVDALIRNEGALDVDVRARVDGSFDVTQVR